MTNTVTEETVLACLKVGSKVWFENERQGYTVQARDSRYIICTKPFNARKTVLYTIIDMERMVRGPDNMIFGAGYESREQCIERLSDLQDSDLGMEVSYRKHAPISIVKAFCEEWLDDSFGVKIVKGKS